MASQPPRPPATSQSYAAKRRDKEDLCLLTFEVSPESRRRLRELCKGARITVAQIMRLQVENLLAYDLEQFKAAFVQDQPAAEDNKQ